MLDELLGRAALKDQIATLEEERDRLEAQLAAERERRAEAVSDRQTTDERVNRLEDRIADLEGQLERARGGETRLDFRGRTRLRGDRLVDVLDRFESYETGPEGAFTAMVEEPLPDPLGEAFGERTALLRRAAPCLALTDDHGIVSVALAPPLPPAPFAEWGRCFRLDRSWFLPDSVVGFGLLRSDLFAYGSYEGRDRVGVESFESDVRAKHSKGGFSQARFERRRDEQIDAHLERCRDVLESQHPDRLILVGERTLLGEFADLADRTAPVDATGDPEAALDEAFRDFWTTTLFAV